MNGRSCSGVLIDPVWVLTAASCFRETTAPGAPALPATATIGRTAKAAGHVVAVTRVIPHSDRNVALARLTTPVTNATPIRVATTAPRGRDKLRIAGYGRTTTDWVPDQVHTATVTVGAVNTGTFTITGNTPRTATTCKGDSGGPAIREGGTPELVGLHLTSWQSGCLGETETRSGATETRVDDLGGWLVEQMTALTAGAVAEHTITLSWNAVRAQNPASYRVYGATTRTVPTTPATLLGTTSTPGFVHGPLPAKQTWYYRIVPVTASGKKLAATPVASATVRVPTVSDFNGDSRDDIATFTRGDTADVYTALSNGTKFVQNSSKWQDTFAAGTDIPLTGDFNGDNKDDVISFHRGDTGTTRVALSNGSSFRTSSVWHDHFCLGTEIPAVGDFDGDGRDDIATFTRGDTAEVYVSLSEGDKFVQNSSKWHDHFAAGTEIPAIGDFNGDGRDDIITFTRGTSALAIVSLSTGTGFAPATTWHNSFAVGDEIPAVGDVTGDGRDDVTTFTRGDTADVYVSSSNGGHFVENAWKWHDHFAVGTEIPGIGDISGDGKADILTFTRGDTADVYTALSNGTTFTGDNQKWHDNFAPGTEWPQPSQLLP